MLAFAIGENNEKKNNTKKRIKDLTDDEMKQICKKNFTECADCPLARIIKDTVICLEIETKKEVEIEVLEND